MKTIVKNKRREPINPFVDWGFKYIFGREETKDLLREFLNLLLSPEHPIQEIIYLNPEVLADSPAMKRCVFDVLCTDSNGDNYLIEMQKASRKDMSNRIVYYACRLIDSMGQRTNAWNYTQIKRVYAICIMDFTYEKDPHLRNDIMLRNSREGHIYSDLLNIITLQMPCIKTKSLAECKESYEKLLFLLKSISKNMKTTAELLAEIDALKYISEETKEVFRRVVTTVEDELTEEQKLDYAKDLDLYEETMSEIETGREQGLEEGRAEGLAEGRAEGRALGLAEGRAETMRDVARAMRENGASDEFICKCTGLSMDEIAAL